MKEIMISVIVPIYNAQDYLGNFFENFFNQTFTDYELICVNDGSTDDTKDIISRYSAIDERIVCIEQCNSGAGAARNAGLSRARGKYVICIDADDLYQDNLLECLYNAAEEYLADVTICQLAVKNYRTNLISESQGYNGLPELRKFTVQTNPEVISHINFGPYNKLYRLDFVRQNHLKYTETRVCNDLCMSVQASLLAKSIVCIPNSLITVRTFFSNSSITSNRVKHLGDVSRNLYNLLLWCNQKDFTEAIARELLIMSANSLRYECKFGYNQEFFIFIEKIMSIQPWNELTRIEGKKAIGVNEKYYRKRISDAEGKLKKLNQGTESEYWKYRSFELRNQMEGLNRISQIMDDILKQESWLHYTVKRIKRRLDLLNKHNL